MLLLILILAMCAHFIFSVIYLPREFNTSTLYIIVTTILMLMAAVIGIYGISNNSIYYTNFKIAFIVFPIFVFLYLIFMSTFSLVRNIYGGLATFVSIACVMLFSILVFFGKTVSFEEYYISNDKITNVSLYEHKYIRVLQGENEKVIIDYFIDIGNNELKLKSIETLKENVDIVLVTKDANIQWSKEHPVKMNIFGKEKVDEKSTKEKCVLYVYSYENIDGVELLKE